MDEPLSVSEVNLRARGLLEKQFGVLHVSGELSSTRYDAAGHRWFCLKDAKSVLWAVMFRRDAAALRWPAKDGDQAIARGRLTIYPANGKYQIVVQHLEPAGAGALQAAFEELKRRLQAAGLFDPQRKRRLPLLPRRVAVITSPTGAVIRDIVQVARRRFPRCDLLVLAVRVQGADCGAGIAAAIERAGSLGGDQACDLLICARGGGSLEDLWGFNDERVAMALARSPIPTVSAVGHETDFTIADFVADVRAPTPSAAAELVFPIYGELVQGLLQAQLRLAQGMRRRLSAQRLVLRALRSELGDGRRQLNPRQQALSLLQQRLARGFAAQLQRQRQRQQRLLQGLQRAHPQRRLAGLRALHLGTQRQLRGALEAGLRRRRTRLQGVAPSQLMRAAGRQLQGHRQHLTQLTDRLQALSPLAILGRGYSIVRDAAGRVVRDARAVAPGDALQVRPQHGQLRVQVVYTEVDLLGPAG
jgi:exodeoxyribonuclease VII large subunit